MLAQGCFNPGKRDLKNNETLKALGCAMRTLSALPQKSELARGRIVLVRVGWCNFVDRP